MVVGAAGFPFDENFAAEIRNLKTAPGGPPGSGTRGQRATISIPRYKYTYLVEFVISSSVAPTVLTNSLGFITNGRLYSQLKSIDFPKINFVLKKLNSYNKIVNVPVRVEYQPATMIFHDDASSMVMALFTDYLNYYHTSAGIGSESADMLDANLRHSIQSQYVGDSSRLGMEERPSLGMRIRKDEGRCFFEEIIIHDLGTDPDSINRHCFINPTITNFDHDNYDHEDKSSKQTMSWTFEYESYTVKIGEPNTVSAVLGVQTFGKALYHSASTGHAKMDASGETGTRSTLGDGVDSLFGRATGGSNPLGGIVNGAVSGIGSVIGGAGDILDQTASNFFGAGDGASTGLRIPDPSSVFTIDWADSAKSTTLGMLPIGSTVPAGSLLETMLNNSVGSELGITPAGTARAASYDNNFLGSSGIGFLNNGVSFSNGGFNTGTFSITQNPNYYSNYNNGYSLIDSATSRNQQSTTRIDQLQRDRNWALAMNPNADTSYYDREINNAQRSVNVNSGVISSITNTLLNNRDTQSALLNTIAALL